MKTAFISGASHGIGKAIAQKLAAEGCRLALNCLSSKDQLFEFAHELEKNCQIPVLVLPGDIGDPAFAEDAFAQITSRFQGVDFLVNNAGISQIGLLTDLSVSEWQRLLATNLSSVFYCCRQAIPYMVRQKSGKILNISSVWGEVGASCEAAYSASKGGVNALTRALAKELAPSNIQVNAISCGCIDTRMNGCFDAQERAQLEEEIPAGRFGAPQEVAALAYALLSGHDYLTGQIIRLDGGWI